MCYDFIKNSNNQFFHRFNSTNSVLFLDDLLKILKHSENDGKFSYNQRVLMSGIFYLEMPYLLQTLLQRLSHESEDLLPPREIIGKIFFNQNMES